MLKVLIADRFPEEKLNEMKELGLDVRYEPSLLADQLEEAIGDANILCVRSTRVTEKTITNGTGLVLIIRVGSGYNTIDVKAASERGIYVANCPGKNSIAVAELTIGLMLALDRRIPDATAELKANRWDKKTFSKADGIKGKTFGIAGFGRIGQAVAKRALAFEMEVLAWDKMLEGKDSTPVEGVKVVQSLKELCELSDVISVHLPLNPHTEGLFNEEMFAAMKPRTIFINTSRGGLHDREALIKAMKEKELRVGLDVYHDEPTSGRGEFDSPILKLDNFVGTPHIGASTQQAQLAVASEAIRIIKTFIEEGTIPNCVNLSQNTPAECQLIVRHFDKVGALASVLDVLRTANINVQEMSNTIFDGGVTAVATMKLDKRPAADVLEKIQANKDMIIQATLL